MAMTEERGAVKSCQSGHTPPARLAVWTDHEASLCSLALRGDLVAATIGELEEHLDLIVCCQSDEVVIDLGRLQSIDSAGARVLIGLQHYIKARGGDFDIVGADRRTAATLREAQADLAS
jgi:anti-anti-sigma factor